MAALELTECELLEAVARDPGDDGALSVLADYWLEHGEEARGAYLQLQCGAPGERIDLADEEARLAEHVQRWRAPLLRAGYHERLLALYRGLLQWPVAVEAGGPLDGDPELVRLSPRYYRELHALRTGQFLQVMAAEAVTPLRTERVVIKACLDPKDQPHLEREHAILRRVRHPNVSRVLSFAIRPGGPALVLRWAGVSLDAVVAATRRHERTLGVAFAVSVARQLCEALAAIHEAGVVHREVRSDHVLVAADGTVTLIDFGYVDAAEPMWPGVTYGYGRGRISPGSLPDLAPGSRPVGAAGFRAMSSEQVLGSRLDERTDLYSAAILACELVEGVHPVRQENVYALLAAILERDLALPPLPPRIALVIRRALAPRDRRHDSARELGDELAAAAAASSIDTGPHVIAQILCELGIAA